MLPLKSSFPATKQYPLKKKNKTKESIARKQAHPRIGNFQIAAEPIGEYIPTIPSHYQITITIAQQNSVLR